MAIQRTSFMKRGDLYSDLGVIMRCVRRDQSAVTVTMHYLKDGSATVRVGVKKSEYLIPAVLLLKALSPITDRQIFERLMCGDTENTFLSARVEMILRGSQKFNVYSPDDARAYLGNHFRNVLPYLSDGMSLCRVYA